MINTIIDSQELLDFCEEHNVRVTVNYEDRFGTCTLKMRRGDFSINYSVDMYSILHFVNKSNWLMDTLERMLKDLEANGGKEI